ncbi:MAG: hypothetical protein MK135_04700, partial [Polyangiaceae bacterium]|nr:hypothetical protein [Polyangiaceae bacterium]
AVEFLTDHYSSKEAWDELVRVFERPLGQGGSDEERLGEMLQVAMLHWKKRGSALDAEPWFDRIRKIAPAHEGVIDFFREHKKELGDEAGLVQILQAAVRALPDDSELAQYLSLEVADFAETQASAHKAIEEQKALYHADPENREVREELKKLYKQTQGHNALIDLLRQQFDRLEKDDYEGRLEVLREQASVYREYIKSDTALVNVLNQIVDLDGVQDEHDVKEVRELVGLYERLGRHRDLLASQKLLAEIVPDAEEKKVLYRRVGRRWLEQFSNVQHAMEAFAALHQLDAEDPEAIERLDELYRKRRAWKELYALYDEQLQKAEGMQRVPLLKEMAQLAAERLSRVDDALEFYREILALDPTRMDVIERMEKHADRSKNWEILAEVLECKLQQMPEDESRLPVLQKLGGVYADHLKELEKAIGTWRRVLAVQPGHARALRVLRDTFLKGFRFDELEELYISQNDTEGLAEVLSTAADRSKDAEHKVDLSYRAARVYEERLDQPVRAIRSYERILTEVPEEVRAIERLLPLYEQEEKWARVPALLETLAQLVEDVDEKIVIYRRLSSVAETKLSD